MPDLIYNVKLNLDEGSLGKIVDPSAEREVKDLQQQVRQLEEALERAGNESGNFKKKVKGTTKQVGENNKAFSSTNQLLFSFSDGVQDAAQFSQGLAQGMRAIGNNVGFTAELFANLTARVSEYNDNLSKAEKAQGKQKTVLGEIKNSFFSAGGALIFLNAALTAGQFAFNKFGKSAKEVNDVINEFVDSSAQLKDIGGFDFLNIESLRLQIKEFERLKNVVKENNEQIDALTQFEKSLTVTGFALATLPKVTDDSEKALRDFKKSIGALADVDIKVINEELEKLNKNLALKEGLAGLNTLSAYMDGIDATTKKVLLFTEAGLDAGQSLEDLADELKFEIEVTKLLMQTNDEHIGTYEFLVKQYDKVTSAIKLKTDAEERENKLEQEKIKNRNQLISDTSKLSFISRRNAEFIAREIEILNEKDEIAKISAQAQLDRGKAQFQFNMEQDALETRLLEAGVSRNQINRALAAAEAEFDEQLNLITAQELLAIAQAQADREVEIAEEKADLIKRITEQQEKDRQDQYQKTLDFIQGTIDDELLFNKLKRENELADEDEKGRVIGEIEDKYQAKRDALRAGGLFNKQILAQLEIAEDREISDASIALDQKAKDAKIQNAKDLLQIAGTISQGLFDNQKATAVANAVMNTYEAATKALTAAPPPFNKILMAATIASGIAQVKKIIKTKPGDKNVSGDAGGGSVSVPQRGFFETNFRGTNSFQDPSMDRFTPSSPESVGATIVLQGSLDEEVMTYKVKSGNARIESGTTYLGD